MSGKIALGLDLGTTFSAVSVKANGRITEASFPGEGPQLASVVYWPDGEMPIIGQKAMRAAYKHAEFLYTHFKRRMYDDANNQAYGGHSAIELSAEVLREVLKVVCKSYPEIQQHLDGSKPRENLVIGVTHPASWGVHQTDGIREAGRLAGFEIDSFIPEPNAAAYRLLEETQHRVSQGDLIGVIDIGGGTTDCTVHQLSQGKLNTVVGATGNGLLGGDNITGLIFEYFADALKLRFGDCFDPERGLNLAHPSLNSDKKRRLAIELWNASSEAKEQLSTSENATVFLSGNSGPEELILNAANYDQLTNQLFETYRTAIGGMLAGSKYSFSDIHHLALAGGSAMARGVLKHTAEVCGKLESEILISGNSSHVVASGAAIACFTGEEADSHVGRGFGIRLVASANGSKRYTNKMIVPTNTIIKSGGEVYQDTGQRIETKGGISKLRIQFVEAKAAVVVPHPEAGIPSLLDDTEVNRLQEVVHDLDLPEGEHNVLVGFSINSGSTHYQISFPDSTIEGVAGRLMSGSFGNESELEQQSIDLCIALDISGSMDGAKIRNAVKAIKNVVNQTANTDVRVAVVVFGSQNGLLCPFGTAPKDIIQAVKSLIVGSGTPMTEAFDNCEAELRCQRSGSHKLAILVTDGHPNDPQTAEVAASRLKSSAELICFGIGDVDEGYLVRIATSPNHYFYTDDPSRIPALFDSILEMFLN